MKEHEKTAADLLYEAVCEFCNNYCKIPGQHTDFEDIPYPECSNCPLHKIGV